MKDNMNSTLLPSTTSTLKPTARPTVRPTPRPTPVNMSSTVITNTVNSSSPTLNPSNGPSQPPTLSPTNTSSLFPSLSFSPSFHPSSTPSTSLPPTLSNTPTTSLTPTLIPTNKPISTFSKEGMTLQAIGFTLGGGLCVSLLAVVAFGIAVSRRSTNIAPRCTARHPNTIYRRRKDIYKKKSKSGDVRGKEGRVAAVALLNGNNSGGNGGNSGNNNSGGSGGNESKTPRKNLATTAVLATKKSTTLATKLVTGLDLNGLSLAEKQIKQEEEEQRKEFKVNAIGQPVYVGVGARSKVEAREGMTTNATVRTGSTVRSGSSHHTAGGGRTIDSSDSLRRRHTSNSNEDLTQTNSGGRSLITGQFNSTGQLYDIDSGIPMDEFGIEMSNAKTLNNTLNNLNETYHDDQPDYDTTTSIHPQDRGNPFLGWIPWTLHLSYDRMLRGIPGTGTRDGGMGGKLLGVNLDAVVLFRFHDLCLRVTAVATFFCICIILPLNLTACSDSDDYCTAQTSKLTNYGRTTIANIYQTTNTTSLNTHDFQFWTSIFWTHSSVSHLMRLYAISLCTWVITWYTLKSVKREWRENLVLRRVYYLEADHYGNRQSELDKTIYNPRSDDTDDESEGSDDEDDIRKRRAINKGQHDKKAKYKVRQPWIPDPEHRDTIPNIELYSVLVGGLPSLPTEVVNTEDIETAIGFSKRASIDWQLAVATTFFDHCVPNQPGFSSSVVAVTILPAAPELAKAWRKWYAAAAALRRLRFIRTVIYEKRHYDIDEVGGGGEEEESVTPIPPTPNNTERGVSSVDASTTGRMNSIRPTEFYAKHTPTRDDPQSKPKVTFLDDDTASGRFQDAETNRQVSQYRQTFGQTEASDLDYRIFRSLNYGPEQQAVYSREMAQGAAACCPHGCCEGRVRRQPIDRLLEMEEATIQRLENAQHQLQNAQMEAAVSIVDKGDNTFKKKKSFDETEMMLQSDTIRNSPTRPSTGYSSEENAPLPTLEEIFSRSDEGLESIAIQPKHSHPMDCPADQWASHLTKPSGSHSSQDDGSNSSRNKLSNIDTTQSKSTASDASTKSRNNRTSGNAGLQTINEYTSDRGLFSPSRASFLRMTSEARFLFDNAMDDEDESSSVSNNNPTSVEMNGADLMSPTTTESSLRRRTLTGYSSKTKNSEEQTSASNQWEQVKNILRKDDVENTDGNKAPEIETGVWTMPSFKVSRSSAKKSLFDNLKAIGQCICVKTRNNLLTQKIAKDSTYAVVTFSSRQAAIAARHCVADGRGVHRWLSLETVPVPPLADAAPCDMITCRGCCRPVTLNLNQNQLLLRRYIALASLVSIYIFYTIPITAAQKVVEPNNLKSTLPGFYNFLNHSTFLTADLVSGLVSGLLYTTFFALCPVMFKMIANAGSQATSVQEAEKYALQYYWYFMLTTAFVFTYLADAAFEIWNSSNLEDSLNSLATKIANATPLTTSATWLNWIIVRTTMTLPLQYMLQVNTFVFSWIGWKCCARCTMGGGPGGPIPYRIYIDGGVVFVCVIALAPQSPLVAPIALLYYIVCTPLWRRNCIFMYRPKFDSGGERWPFLSEVMLTSLFMGQFLLTLQMTLRDALGPALFAGLPAVPTYLYRNYLHKRFKRAYQDAGLLQTSLLDGWDNSMPSSAEKREEFRRFLVDAHKAAYIPVCIAGGATNILTAEPAVVIPNENDDMLGFAYVAPNSKPEHPFIPPESPHFGNQALDAEPSRGSVRDIDEITVSSLQANRGAYMRRTMSFSTPRNSVASQIFADNAAPGIAAEGNKQTLFSQKWQKAQEEVENWTLQNEDHGCAQQ